MYEVEVKVSADHGAVRDRLAAMDAEPLNTVVQDDTYYDHPTRSFAETDEALRIRREESPESGRERAALTYKGPRVDDGSKTREEAETPIEDPDAIGRILGALGFAAAATVRKERERFAVDGFTVTLDTVDGLGQFVEVEAEGGADEIDALRDGALAVVSRLGLDPGEQIRTSYLELLVES